MTRIVSRWCHRGSRGSKSTSTSNLAQSSTIKAPFPSQALIQFLGLSELLTSLKPVTGVLLQVASMRHHTGWLSVLSVPVLFVFFAVVAHHATPSPLPWNEMIIKHKWDAVPDNWVSLGQPPNGTTVKLHIALKANREKALIDALHEVSHPRHPKHVLSLVVFSSKLFHVFRFSVSDTARIYQWRKLLSLSRPITTRSSLCARGLNTTACRPPPFQGQTAAAG